MGWIGKTWARLTGGRRKEVTLVPSAYPLSVAPYRDDPTWAVQQGQTAETRRLTDSLWVYACCRLIAQAVASVPLRVEDHLGQPHTYHPALSLLDQPTPDSDYTEWATRRTYNLLLTGADYLELQVGELAGERLVVELWPYPEGVYKTEARDPRDGRPVILCYRKFNVAVPKQQVIRSTFTAPGDYARGLAPAVALAIESSADREAGIWQASSFQNRLLPDGVFTVPTSDPAEVLKAEEYILEAWARARNAHTPIVLGGGATDALGNIVGSASMSYQRVMQTALESDFVKSREQGMARICAGFGVPDVLFAASSSTYANLPAARRWFWETTVMPLVQLQVGALNRQLMPYYGAGLKLVPDFKAVAAWRDIDRDLFSLAKQMADLGVPMSQVNDRLALGLEPWDGWQHSLVGPAGARFPLGSPEQIEVDIEATRAEATGLVDRLGMAIDE